MKKYIRLSAISLVASAFLIGCSSDSSTEDSTSTTLTETGYFIDAPVQGLTYRTSSGQTGVTDSRGSFKYKKGEKVNFSIGKLNLGEAEPTTEGLVSPRELTQNQELVTLILRTLQALDVDNDPSNGITIPATVINALQNMDKDILISELSEDSDILNIDTDLSEVLDEDYDGEIDVNDEQAEAHFEESMNSWNTGTKPTQQQGQGQGQGQGNGQAGHGEGEVFDLSTYPDSTLTQEVKESLAYMGNEERLAYDIYMNLSNYHNDAGLEIKQLINIPKSEQKHVEIVQSVIQKYNIDISTLENVVNPVADKDVAFGDMPMGVYDIPAIQDLYDMLYEKGIKSQQDALEVGCMVEVVDIDDLNKFIIEAEASNATDIVDAFNILRDGSYNHFWAFDKGLKAIGVTQGCAVLGEEYLKATQEYPQNSHSH